jgi:hypothetical protein
VEGAHRLALQVEIEIDVELASLAIIAPDGRRRRLGPLPRFAQERGQPRLIKPDQPVEAAGRRCRDGRLGQTYRHRRHRGRRRLARRRWRWRQGVDGFLLLGGKWVGERELLAARHEKQSARGHHHSQSPPDQVHWFRHARGIAPSPVQGRLATRPVNVRLTGEGYAIGRLLTTAPTWFHGRAFCGKVRLSAGGGV